MLSFGHRSDQGDDASARILESFDFNAELRALGQEVRVVYLQLDLPAFGGSISMAERITDMHPRERPPSKRSMSRVDVPTFQQVVTPPPGLGAGPLDAFRHVAHRSLSPWAMV